MIFAIWPIKSCLRRLYHRSCGRLTFLFVIAYTSSCRSLAFFIPLLQVANWTEKACAHITSLLDCSRLGEPPSQPLLILIRIHLIIRLSDNRFQLLGKISVAAWAIKPGSLGVDALLNVLVVFMNRASICSLEQEAWSESCIQVHHVPSRRGRDCNCGCISAAMGKRAGYRRYFQVISWSFASENSFILELNFKERKIALDLFRRDALAVVKLVHTILLGQIAHVALISRCLSANGNHIVCRHIDVQNIHERLRVYNSLHTSRNVRQPGESRRHDTGKLA